MALPKWLAALNRRATNHVTRPLARWLPGFGVVIHRGRRSGRVYRTPVNVFRTGDGYAIALTYGPKAEWVKNVLAAGGCELEVRGREVRLVEPRIIRDPRRRLVPPPVRAILRLVGVSYFLILAFPQGSPQDRAPLT